MSTNQQLLEQLEESAWKVPSESDGRSPWRKRLAETERGFTACFRANSSMFFYFFSTCILLSVAFVLGLNGLEWAVLVLAITAALCSEVLHFSIHKILEEAGDHIPHNISQLLKMTRAAFMLLLAGSTLTITILLGSKCIELYMHNF